MPLSICIFAHNEARLLPRCVAALEAAADGLDYRAHVLANGCTDGTVSAARALAAGDARLRVCESPVGDKANAWNDYVYDIAEAGAAATHVFLDGDIRPGAGAFAHLARALRENPRAYAAAALPGSGRSRKRWAAELSRNHYISGNLYALSETALAAFRARRLRLPFGAKGEDGLISYLLLTDLEGGRNDAHKDRIAVCDGARFEFDPLQLNLTDLGTYRRRLNRYAERHFQKQILYRLLKEGGVSAMPDNIYDIYTAEAMAALKPRLDPVNFWFDLAALKRLRAGGGRR